MVSFKAALLALAAAGTVSADGLHTRAKGVGRYWGTAINPSVMNDAPSWSIGRNKEDFGAYTCENEMKFDALERSRGVFTYGDADKIVQAAQQNGQFMRCHTLVWYAQVPSWVANGNFNNATLISIMKNHIANVVGHFKGKCTHWDVVNEALSENGQLRPASETVWGRTIGPAYIPIAFAAAAAADPAAKLYYNDYNCDRPGPKSTGAQNLIRMVKAYGAPIHGMGLQGHMTTGQVGSQANLISNLNAFTALGVDVAYTELDIATPSNNPNFQQQALDYATVVGACKAVARCVGITAWGFTDKHTWIKNSYPLIWDTSLQKKAAYNAIINAWGTDSNNPPTTTTTTNRGPAVSTGSTCSPLYGQCGGSNWTGPKCCQQGTCKSSNDWYSQCL
jgi:endo-1,4-beta-xylanase